MKLDPTLNRIIQGTPVPAIGFGTWDLEGDTAVAAVGHALDAGYRRIDTAQIYGNEAEVGAAIARSDVPRDEIFVTTKIWRDAADKAGVRRTMGESLERLGLDAVDLVLLHWPNPDVPLAETLDALIDLREKGLTRHIGVSNFTPALLREALGRAPLFSLQCEYHPYLDQDTLIGMCREAGMMFTAYCPIAQGKVLKDETLKAIGERHGKSPVQVTLRWLAQQPGVTAIPRSSSKSHIAANLDIADFELTADEMHTISKLRGDARIVDPDFAPW